MGCGLSVIDRLNRLRHDAIIRCDHQHDDVGHVSTTRAHSGESRVARSIDKGNFRSVVIDAVGADMLGNPASFTCGHPRFANRIHQRSLAVINMSHERNDGTAWLEFFFLFNDRRRRRDDNLFDLVNTGALLTALALRHRVGLFHVHFGYPLRNVLGPARRLRAPVAAK